MKSTPSLVQYAVPYSHFYSNIPLRTFKNQLLSALQTMVLLKYQTDNMNAEGQNAFLRIQILPTTYQPSI